MRWVLVLLLIPVAYPVNLLAEEDSESVKGLVEDYRYVQVRTTATGLITELTEALGSWKG